MRIALFSAALFTSGLALADPAIDGWYTSAFGGYAYLPGNVNIVATSGLTNATSWKTGYFAGARLGFQSNPFRYEGEYTYLNANVNFFNVNNIQQTGIFGDSIANFVMANIYFDTPELLPAVTSFLGVGIGYAYLTTTLSSTGPNAATFFKAAENEFAYQATLGLTYNFSENYALNLAYRYVATPAGSSYGEAFQAHLVGGSVIYRFDYGNYK